MHLCSLSITYACPTITPPPPWATRSTTLTSAKPLTHTTPYTLSAICPVQWKPDSSVKRTPLQSARCHGMWANCSPGRGPRWRTTSMQMSFPEMVSDSLCRNYLVMQTDCCSSWTSTFTRRFRLLFSTQWISHSVSSSKMNHISVL